MYDQNKRTSKQKRTVGNSAAVILGQFFNQILNDNNVKPKDLDFFMTRYVQDPVNGFPQDRRSISSARGNLRKELLNKYMSWRVFCKGLRFIKIKRFTLTIRAEYSKGEIKEHSVSVDLNLPDEEIKHYAEIEQ